MGLQELLIYGIPASILIVGYVAVRFFSQRAGIRRQMALQAQGVTEPASLHPVIDARKCIGCGACASACPERGVLGLVSGKATLVDPSRCIGHGECARSCPLHAITLVFGTATRGVDIPMVNADFQTNVPGIFIAGELGGMGLIRNAIEQGKQAMASIINLPRASQKDVLDVLIVGAGPAGIAASLAAQDAGLNYRTLEQDSLGGTVSHYPRGKIVMTSSVDLPIIGQIKMTETSKEALLELWQGILDRTNLSIEFSNRVTKVESIEGGFEVHSLLGNYKTNSILLAIGRRGTPRTLNVQGESLSKVTYRLIDAEEYKGKKVLVVGGGDSALEAAVTISEQPGSEVILSYRSGGFSRAKAKNRDRVDEAVRAGSLHVMLSSNVKEITESYVRIEQDGKIDRFDNDGVIICAGGILPTGFLNEIGVQVETKYGTA